MSKIHQRLRSKIDNSQVISIKTTKKLNNGFKYIQNTTQIIIIIIINIPCHKSKQIKTFFSHKQNGNSNKNYQKSIHIYLKENKETTK